MENKARIAFLTNTAYEKGRHDQLAEDVDKLRAIKTYGVSIYGMSNTDVIPIDKAIAAFTGKGE